MIPSRILWLTLLAALSFECNMVLSSLGLLFFPIFGGRNIFNEPVKSMLGSFDYLNKSIMEPGAIKTRNGVESLPLIISAKVLSKPTSVLAFILF
jgi:hypothetical protein